MPAGRRRTTRGAASAASASARSPGPARSPQPAGSPEAAEPAQAAECSQAAEATGDLPAPPANQAPAISQLKLTGTRISLRLSEPAKLRLSFERRRQNRNGTASWWVKLSTTIAVGGKSGTNRVSFNARRRGFAPGSYRLTVRATDSSGKRSAPVSLRFRVAARRRSHTRSSAFASRVAGLEVFTRRA